MSRNLHQLEAETQRLLDDLWSEEAIPFALNVGKIVEGDNDYVLHFYDSRIHSAHIPTTYGPFSERVKSAVLARVAIMDGP